MKSKRREVEELSTFERQLMLAMGLTDVEKLDELLSAPINPEAAAHSEPPDEEYELLDRIYEQQERQRDAQERFDALVETPYLN